MWMWGCEMIRTARSWIRICRHHMVSEASAPRFVFRTRASPACRTECVKMQFHVQREEPERAIIDSGFSCFWSVNTKVHVCHQESVRRHRCWMSTKNNMLSASAFLTSCLWGQKRPGQSRIYFHVLCFGTKQSVSICLSSKVSHNKRSILKIHSITENVSPDFRDTTLHVKLCNEFTVQLHVESTCSPFWYH